MSMALTVVLLTTASVVLFAKESVERRLETAVTNNALTRFVSYPDAGGGGVFKANTNFWAGGIDFSCASPLNSCSGRMRAGTLISPRHIIGAKHFPLSVGARILFVGEGGWACPCYIEKTKALPDCDIQIGLLNAEVSPDIHPAKILPQDYVDYIGAGEGLPTVRLNQFGEAVLYSLAPLPTNGQMRANICFRNPVSDRGRLFTKKTVMYDSGGPMFLLIGDMPVLLCCLYGGAFGSGPAIHCRRVQIQAAMDELCPGYKLEAFDFKKVRVER